MKYFLLFAVANSETKQNQILNFYKNLCVFHVKNTGINVFVKEIIPSDNFSNLRILLLMSNGLFFINLFKLINDRYRYFLISKVFKDLDTTDFQKNLQYIRVFFYILKEENNNEQNKEKILQIFSSIINEMQILKYDILVIDDKYLKEIKDILAYSKNPDFNILSIFSIFPCVRYQRKILVHKNKFNGENCLKNDLINIFNKLEFNKPTLVFRLLTKRWLLIRKKEEIPLNTYFQKKQYSIDIICRKNYMYLLPFLYKDDKKSIVILEELLHTIICNE